MKTRNHADEAAAVRIWLASQGYPLELRVGRILRDAGWHVEHARWFEDLETGKLRELDVTATLWFEASRVEPAVKLEIAVECKSSPSKPWVAFTTQRQDVSPWLRPTAVADEYSRDALATASARKVTIPELIRPTTRLSHGVVKAHSEGKWS